MLFAFLENFKREAREHEQVPSRSAVAIGAPGDTQTKGPKQICFDYPAHSSVNRCEIAVARDRTRGRSSCRSLPSQRFMNLSGCHLKSKPWYAFFLSSTLREASPSRSAYAPSRSRSGTSAGGNGNAAAAIGAVAPTSAR